MDNNYFDRNGETIGSNGGGNVSLGGIGKSMSSSININNIGRLALSKNICRFELPVDMRQFEHMKPPAYLEKYCRVNNRRKAIYKKVFEKHKKRGDKSDYVDLLKFNECMVDIHMKSVNKTQVNSVLKLACILDQKDQSFQINFALFCGLVALSERMLYDHFVTEDTIDLPEYQKDKVECADFGSLNSKLEGVSINQEMLTLLRAL